MLRGERLGITDGNSVRLDQVNGATHVNVAGDEMTGQLRIDASGEEGLVVDTDASITRPAVVATSSGLGGVGVSGAATHENSNATGVQGTTISAAGRGVAGLAENGTGGFFRSEGATGFGVRAIAAGASGIGVQARSNGTSGTALMAEATGNGANSTALLVNHDGFSAGVIARFQSRDFTRYTIEKNGNATLTGTHFAADHVNTSDARLKRDVTPLEDVLPKLDQINGVRYRLRDDEPGSDYRLGVLAQEVRSVFPELVEERADGYLGVSYGHLSAVLLEAVKEQQRRIEALERKLERLSGQSADLPVEE